MEAKLPMCDLRTSPGKLRLGFLRYWPPAEAGGEELDDDSEDDIEAPRGTASTEAEVDSHIFLVILFAEQLGNATSCFHGKIAKNIRTTNTHFTFHGKRGPRITCSNLYDVFDATEHVSSDVFRRGAFVRSLESLDSSHRE